MEYTSSRAGFCIAKKIGVASSGHPMFGVDRSMTRLEVTKSMARPFQMLALCLLRLGSLAVQNLHIQRGAADCMCDADNQHAMHNLNTAAV